MLGFYDKKLWNYVKTSNLVNFVIYMTKSGDFMSKSSDFTKKEIFIAKLGQNPTISRFTIFGQSCNFISKRLWESQYFTTKSFNIKLKVLQKTFTIFTFLSECTNFKNIMILDKNYDVVKFKILRQNSITINQLQ